MKYLSYICCAILCCSFLFFGCGDDAPDDTGMEEPEVLEYTLYPGKGINNLSIGDPGGKVATVLGGGFQRLVGEGFSGKPKYNYYNESKGIDVIFGEQDSEELDIDTLPIKSFHLGEGFEGMTETGITVGSTKAEVLAAYGEPDEVDWFFDVYYSGILFAYNDEDILFKIVIIE